MTKEEYITRVKQDFSSLVQWNGGVPENQVQMTYQEFIDELYPEYAESFRKWREEMNKEQKSGGKPK